MTFRDWPRTLRPASYRGARFFVEKDTIETGRRLVVHEFPLKDVPYVEDLGRDANKISVTAYVVGDSADGEERALRRACESGGAGRLSLPMEALQAHCESCSRDFAKDKLGYVAFSLKFVREGTGGGAGGQPAAFLGAMVGRAASALVVAAGARFLAGFRTSGAAGFVRDAAAAEVRGLAATLLVMADGLPLDRGLAPAVHTGVRGIYDDADALATVGEPTGRLGRTSALPPSSAADRQRSVAAELASAAYLGSGRGGSLPPAASAIAEAAPDGPPPALVVRLAAVVETMRLAVAPEVWLAESVTLTVYQPAGPVPPTATPSRRRIAANAVAMAETVRLVALAAWAEAAAARIFTDRRQAIQARADAAEMFAAEMEALGEPGRYHARVETMEIAGRLAEYLTRRIADLAPVIGVETGAVMPSLWWSQRIYGTAHRAGELTARNRVIHASFMPATFEALAR